ncbi:hypothetical protein [Sorangium sp. So ce131]|uniref:hypothetical protein n=1 Tax=Sorangium sp. So ce131 TaxID=3133282 RepID=UPI003F61E768
MRLAAAFGSLLGIGLSSLLGTGLSLDLARAEVPPVPAPPAAPPPAAAPAEPPPAEGAAPEPQPGTAGPQPGTAEPQPGPSVVTTAPDPVPTHGYELTAESATLHGGSVRAHATLHGGSVRATATNLLLLPAGDLEIGGEMTFVTSELPLGGGRPGEGLAFTDVGLLTLNGRYSFGPVELAAAMALLVKQPSYADELVPQNGSLTARAALGEGQALGLRLAGGPLLGDLGLWEGAELALEAKRDVHETLDFRGAIGGAFTHLDFADGAAPRSWLGELVVDAEVVLRTPRRAFSSWVGADMRFPLVHDPGDEGPGAPGFLEPRTRLNFYVGGAYSYVDDWDVYVRFTVLDRGDKDDPGTMAPILDGGFDQQQITLGVVHRWELGEKDDHAERWGD